LVCSKRTGLARGIRETAAKIAQQLGVTAGTARTSL
jgi:hypothetical protein